jgi:hypothetical protein
MRVSTKIAMVTITLFIIVSLSILILKPRESLEERVCNNLVNSGYLENTQKCIINGDTQIFLDRVFPPREVDISYVRAGMRGFDQFSEGQFVCDGQNCSTLEYVIKRRPFWGESYEFIFVNGVLERTYWNN